MCEIFEKKRILVEMDSGEELIVEYAILIHRIPVEEGIYFDCYGIRVSTYSKENQAIDCSQISNITMNVLEIKRIFMLLLKYTVTPVSLYDVMDVYLADPEHFACFEEEFI